MRQPLHPRRPVGARHTGLECGGGKLQPARPQRRDRRAGILELMAAVEPRRRQIEEPVAILINEAAAFLGRGPGLARDGERRPHPRRLSLDHGERLAGLTGNNGGHAGLEDAGFLRRNLFDRIAEKVTVIDRDAGDDTGQRPLDHVGGVQPASEPDFKQQHIGRMMRKQQKRRRSLHLKHGDRRAVIFGFALAQRIDQIRVIDEIAADAKALMRAHEMWRRINVNALACRFQNGARERDRRTLAVGAGDVNKRR